MNFMYKRNVIINENAVKRAEKFIEKSKREKGVNYTIGSIFAIALDEFLKKEK